MSCSCSRGQREQLRARDGLDDVEHQLSGVARVVLRHRQYVADPPGDQWDVEHVRAHRRHREEPDESMLDVVPAGVNSRVATLLPAGAALPDHHDVGIRAVSQEAGHRRLGEHQQIVAAAEFRQHLGAQPGHPEPTRLVDGGLPSLTVQLWHPSSTKCPSASQRRRSATSARSGPGKRVPESVSSRWASDCEHRAQRRGVLRHLAGVGDHHRQQPLGLGQRLAVRPRATAARGSRIRRCCRDRARPRQAARRATHRCGRGEPRNTGFISAT